MPKIIKEGVNWGEIPRYVRCPDCKSEIEFFTRELKDCGAPDPDCYGYDYDWQLKCPLRTCGRLIPIHRNGGKDNYEGHTNKNI